MIDAGPYAEIVEYVREHEPEIWTEVVIRVGMQEGWSHTHTFYVDKNGDRRRLHDIEPSSPELESFFEMFGRLKEHTSAQGNDWYGLEFRMWPSGEYDTKFFHDPDAFHDSEY